MDKSALKTFYKDQLLNDTLPFWFPRAVDRIHGGYLLMRERDGRLLDDDKAVWFQGRFAWLLATLYNTVEKKQQWLEGAHRGIAFLRAHCFDEDGRMYFHMTRDGKPIRKRRYFFSETFAVMAYAAYARASGNETIAEEARLLFSNCIAYATEPALLPTKFTRTRPFKSIRTPLMLIHTAQQLRDTIGDKKCDEWITTWIQEIARDFVKHDLHCVMEQVDPDGHIIDHLDGRTLNPGQAIEGAWFVLHEARHRGTDPDLIALGCAMLDYMWERGWDKKYGGLFSFRDVYDKPAQACAQDMKLWWPHTEAMIATLLAYELTGKEQYARKHELVRDYAYQHFHDKQNGGWFGYLHRDGSVAQTAKGNLFKGPYHLPRAEWYCWQLLTTRNKD